MVITCPNCGSTFNLPPDRIKPEARARCAVCSHIFQLRQGLPNAVDNPFLGAQTAPSNADAPAAAPAAEESYTYKPFTPKAKPKKKGRRAALVICIFVLAAVLAGGAYYYFLRDSGGTDVAGNPDQEQQIEEIAFDHRRQYVKENQYLGRIVVIDGVVVNKGERAKNFIKLEAAFYKSKDEVVMSKQFFCGPELKQAQLETMGEVEMEQWLTNETDVFRLNTNVKKDDQVPFMVVFYRPPAELFTEPQAYSYRLRVIEAPYAEEK